MRPGAPVQSGSTPNSPLSEWRAFRCLKGINLDDQDVLALKALAVERSPQSRGRFSLDEPVGHGSLSRTVAGRTGIDGGATPLIYE